LETLQQQKVNNSTCHKEMMRMLPWAVVKMM